VTGSKVRERGRGGRALRLNRVLPGGAGELGGERRDEDQARHPSRAARAPAGRVPAAVLKRRRMSSVFLAFMLFSVLLCGFRHLVRQLLGLLVARARH
jgi:hypothetical protein